MKFFLSGASFLLFLNCGGHARSENTISGVTAPAVTEASESAEARESAGAATAQAANAVAASAQTVAGEQVWSDHCAMCHGDSGEGRGKAKAVVGPQSLSQFSDANALMTYIGETMPKTDPGVLSESESASVTAYILSTRGTPANLELTVESASSISIEPVSD